MTTVGCSGRRRCGLARQKHRLPVLQIGSERKRAQKTGWATEMSIRQNTRHLDWASIQNALSPDFGNQLSFVERVDAIAWMPQLGYQWFPETWIRNWSVRISPQKLWDFDGLLQNDTRWNPSVTFTFSKNVKFSTSINRSMERYRGIEFDKTRWSASGSINTSQRLLLTASVDKRSDSIHHQSVFGRLPW